MHRKKGLSDIPPHCGVTSFRSSAEGMVLELCLASTSASLCVSCPLCCVKDSLGCGGHVAQSSLGDSCWFLRLPVYHHLHLRFSSTSMPGSPHHRLVLRVCVCSCPLVCGCAGLSLTSVQRVSKCNGHLFLKKSIMTTPTPTSQGPSAYCWPGPVITLSITCPSSLSSGFSLKEKLGSTGPGVSRTKTAVLRQRRSPGRQIQ